MNFNSPNDIGDVINIDKDGCYFMNNNQDLAQKSTYSRSSTFERHNGDVPENSKPNLSIYSDSSDAAERKNIDQIEPESRGLTVQDSNDQMTNCVSFVESLSRPFLNKKMPIKKQARCLGSWAYNGPGYDNEAIGKIEKDGVVVILNSTMDLIWHSIR
jgi:hypothetical protein